LRDLLQRVPLQNKEINHLIRCGALDNLGDSRKALLSLAKELGGSDNLMQLPLFAENTQSHKNIATETIEEKAAWELELLGYPLTSFTNPLHSASPTAPGNPIPIRELHVYTHKQVLIAGIRLPGWTGGSGFYLWDGHAWIIAHMPPDQPTPPIWIPITVRGRLQQDEWGSVWFQINHLIKDQP
jgi:hypothetical protein